MTQDPIAASRSISPAEVSALEDAAAAVDPSFVRLGPLPADLDPGLWDRAVADHAALCLVLVLQRGGPTDMRHLAVALDEMRADDTQPVLAAGQFGEWARLLSVAASRKGSATVEQTLRGWKGRTATILQALLSVDGPVTRGVLVGDLANSGQAIGDDSAMSHMLRELEDAGLATRIRIGRETLAELTASGRAVALDLAPQPPQPSRRRRAMPMLKALPECALGQRERRLRVIQSASITPTWSSAA